MWASGSRRTAAQQTTSVGRYRASWSPGAALLTPTPRCQSEADSSIGVEPPPLRPRVIFPRCVRLLSLGLITSSPLLPPPNSTRPLLFPLAPPRNNSLSLICLWDCLSYRSLPTPPVLLTSVDPCIVVCPRGVTTTRCEILGNESTN